MPTSGPDFPDFDDEEDHHDHEAPAEFTIDHETGVLLPPVNAKYDLRISNFPDLPAFQAVLTEAIESLPDAHKNTRKILLRMLGRDKGFKHVIELFEATYEARMNGTPITLEPDTHDAVVSELEHQKLSRRVFLWRSAAAAMAAGGIYLNEKSRDVKRESMDEILSHRKNFQFEVLGRRFELDVFNPGAAAKGAINGRVQYALGAGFLGAITYSGHLDKQSNNPHIGILTQEHRNKVKELLLEMAPVLTGLLEAYRQNIGFDSPAR